MRRWGALGMGIALWACAVAGGAVAAGLPAGSGAAPKRPAAPARSAAAARVEAVTLFVRHRIFHDFAEEHRVPLNRSFRIGDTDYSARVMQYVPDFAMDMKTRKVVSRSSDPNNPAFRIVVRLKGQPQDTTWALLNMPPHFARNSLLAFKVMRIEFAGRPPVVNPDTTAMHSAGAAP